MRINERLGVFQPGCCGSPMDNDLNMGLVAFEFEKCLKQTRMCNTLSLQCGAGVAFGDDGFGSDVSTGLEVQYPSEQRPLGLRQRWIQIHDLQEEI